VRGWLAYALWFSLAATAVAQRDGYTISGVVVNAITGAPLDRAEVALSTSGEAGAITLQTTTGEDGGFRFDGLPAAEFGLEASRRGYLSASFQEHDGYSTAIVTGPGLQTQNLRFELTPGATINGTVSDDNGDPVSDARVTLFHQDDGSGDGKVAELDEYSTDDAGEYEFSHLKPGTYYVDVSAQPWYAMHPNPRSDLSGNGGPDIQPTSPLDVAYPLTFYPNAPDSGSASPITVNAGDRVQANFSLHAVAAIHVQVRAPLTDGSRGIASPELTQEVFGTPQFSPQPTSTRLDRSTNTMLFDLGSVAPGSYVLRQGVLGSAAVDLTGNGTIAAPSATASTVDVSGKFAMASGSPLPDIPAAVLAFDNDPGGPREIAHMNRNGSFDFSAVYPGTYRIVLHGASVPLAVVGMAASGAEVHNDQITVGSDPVLLAVTLAAGSATVRGFAQRDGRGVGGTMVLLLPSGPSARSDDLIRRDQSNSDGSFSLGDVVPGIYTLMAIENGWNLEWKRPEVIAPYLKGGVTVQVPENQRTLNLKSPVPVQER
jgi:hypothetical protein